MPKVWTVDIHRPHGGLYKSEQAEPIAAADGPAG